MNKPCIHLIGGPTASGKTALALEIAAQENGSVINTDAMQIYRGLPLLTAQPSRSEKASCPHYLFEELAPSEKSSAGHWLALARKALSEIVATGKTPIFVGGTGLYFRALSGGLADIPAIPTEVHEEIISLYEKTGHDEFRKMLRNIDAESEGRIAANDQQRLVRAYEVAKHTGHPLTYWHKKAKSESAIEGYEIKTHLILRDRTELYARCDKRFEQMIERGALEEVRALLTQKLDPALPSMKIIGVPELASHLHGESSLSEAITRAQQATRNYAKRQVTWFSRQKLA